MRKDIKLELQVNITLKRKVTLLFLNTLVSRPSKNFIKCAAYRTNSNRVTCNKKSVQHIALKIIHFFPNSYVTYYL